MSDHGPLTEMQEDIRAKLALGYRLSALTNNCEWCLHPPINSGERDSATAVHFSIGRGLLRRGMLVETHRGPEGRRIFYALRQ